MALEIFQCSMCGRRIKIQNRLDMPIFDPGTGLGICKNCIKDIYSWIEKEESGRTQPSRKNFSNKLGELLNKNKPHIIKEYLDRFIIMQERAKKILSVAAYNHYKRIKYALDNGGEDEIDKSNVIILGPTGCGKTAMLNHLARFLGIPFAVTDASSLTEAGYVGSDVEIAVRNLYYAANKNIEKTEHGIIYLDEFDKIARKSGENNSITADPGHEGVQQGLLKMLEGSVVEFTERGQRKHPEAPTIKINTKNILFICGGAFVGIEKIVEKRILKDNTCIGFGAEIPEKKDTDAKFNELIHQVRPEDLTKYGILPEIVGRLPIICTLETLDEDALMRILTEPQNAPVKQYKKLLAMDDIKLEFEDNALRAVAKMAIERKTGARLLRGIIEDAMLDVMFELPKSSQQRRVIVTEECIQDEGKPKILPIDDKKSYTEEFNE